MWSALAACRFCLCERIQQSMAVMGPCTTMVVDYLNKDSGGRAVIFEEGESGRREVRNFFEEASIEESGCCWETVVSFKESGCRGVSFYQDRRINLTPNS